MDEKFDYDGYLGLLERFNHHYIRMWSWEVGENDLYYRPAPWARPGSGTALDGEPKFDLKQFNPEYFGRLRSRVIAARDRGIYVGVMLFQGWSIYSHGYGNPWPVHPFNQATKPKQHPVGITAFDSGREGSMEALFASPADWISPQNDGVSGDYQNDPPAADGRKGIVSDTDHLWGVGGDRTWVWKSFTRGHNPVYMDPLRKQDWFSISDAKMEGARKAMGDTRRYAERMNLARMAPHGKLSSTRYCLADPETEYLVYQPKGGEGFSLELCAGVYHYEWFDPAKSTVVGDGRIDSRGGVLQFKAPFEGEAVLYLETANGP